MGNVVRKDAAKADIFGDVRSTLTNAQTKGGTLQQLAEERLGPIVTLVDGIEAQLTSVRKTATPLLATIATKNDEADHLLGKVYDQIWNKVGRPANDPALSVIFPGGIAYYAEGDTEGQPDRMEVLVELLNAGLHLKLPKDDAIAAADEVATSCATLRSAVENARKPVAKLGVLERIHTTIARVAQLELANLKRLYKANGFTEAEVHAIIPDRPASPAAKAAAAAPAAKAAPAPAPAAGTPAATGTPV